MKGIHRKRKGVNVLESCWYGQTRLIMEGVFEKPRLCGTFPFDKCYNVLLWPSILVHVTIVLLTLLSISLIPYIDPDYILRGGIAYVFVVRVVKGTTSAIYIILSPLWMVYNQKCLRKLLRNVASVEKKLDEASLRWNKKRDLLSFFFFPAIGCAIVLMQFAFLYLTCGFLCALSLAIVVLSPFPALSYLWQYLALHDVLRSLMIAICKLEDSHSFVNSYHSLVLAYRAIDNFYGLQVMLYLVMEMIIALRGLHYFFFSDSFNSTVIGPLLWACFYSTILLVIIMRCNSSVVQSKAVNAHLYKRMVYEDNNNLIHDELLAFHLSSCRKLVFTACGFFNLDNSLICSMIACATTYLVIMLQFTLPTAVHSNANQSFAEF